MLISIAFTVSAQEPIFTVLKEGTDGDSSYYDIEPDNNKGFWAVGKQGIITCIGQNGEIVSVSNPSNHNDLLSIDRFNSETLIISGDKGFVYQYNTTTKQWNTQQLKGYKNSCFYSICVVDEKTALICGGKSIVAKSGKSIPFGFILKTSDGGKTWKKVYSNIMNMIWRFYMEPVSGKVYVNMYCPNKTKVLVSSNKGDTWQNTGMIVKGLIYDFNVKNNDFTGIGGSSYNVYQSGVIKKDRQADNLFKSIGFLWYYDSQKIKEIVTASKSKILWKNENETDWKIADTKLNSPRNLYKIAWINEHSAYIIGSGQTIVKMEF